MEEELFQVQPQQPGRRFSLESTTFGEPDSRIDKRQGPADRS
jgi:hypothetical protein